MLVCSESAGLIVLIESLPGQIQESHYIYDGAPCDDRGQPLAVIFYHDGFLPRCGRVPASTEI